MQPFERFYTACPYCGTEVPVPLAAALPEEVDGDITLYTPEMLERLFGVKTVDQALQLKVSTFCAVPPGMSPEAVKAIQANHHRKLAAQAQLQPLVSALQPPDNPREAQRKFFLKFGTDIVATRLLNAKDADALRGRILAHLTGKS